MCSFTPHLLPMNRGILANVYLDGDPAVIHATLAARYAAEPFLEVLPFGALPSTRDIRGSTMCISGSWATGCRAAPSWWPCSTTSPRVVGQAIQNANLMLGVDETAGLLMAPSFREGNDEGA